MSLKCSECSASQRTTSLEHPPGSFPFLNSAFPLEHPLEVFAPGSGFICHSNMFCKSGDATTKSRSGNEKFRNELSSEHLRLDESLGEEVSRRRKVRDKMSWGELSGDDGREIFTGQLRKTPMNSITFFFASHSQGQP